MKNLSIFIAIAMAFCMISCEKKEVIETQGNKELEISGTPGQLDAIDLGLSVKWASRNVGATYASDYGGYYAWGETEEKSNYDFSTYKLYDMEAKKFTKYCTLEEYGFVDNRVTLDKADDVAAVKLGGGWRMPTSQEMYELVTKCTWTECSYRGVSGFLAKGPNGNTIFIPKNGIKSQSSNANQGTAVNLWTSSLYAGNEKEYYAMVMTSVGLDIFANSRVSARVGGCGVRAVTK